jgi:hypothetical protein
MKRFVLFLVALPSALVLVLGAAHAIMAQQNEVKPAGPEYVDRNSLASREVSNAKDQNPQAGTAAAEPGEPPAYSPRFYFEPHIGIGGIGPASSLNLISCDRASTPGHPATVYGRLLAPGKMSPALAVGAKVGTWFDYRFLPPLAKYLGFCLNYSYQPLQFSSSLGNFWQTAYHPAALGSSLADWSLVSDPRVPSFSERFTPMGVILNYLTGEGIFRSSGAIHTFGFLFKARYGLWPDFKSPLGRLQPWVGVGPSITFAYQRAVARSDTLTSVNGTPLIAANLNDYYKFRMGADKALGLQAAAGVTWMVFTAVSLDFSVQYDKFTLSYSITTPTHITGTINYPVDNFSFNLGLAYHL